MTDSPLQWNAMAKPSQGPEISFPCILSLEAHIVFSALWPFRWWFLQHQPNGPKQFPYVSYFFFWERETGCKWVRMEREREGGRKRGEERIPRGVEREKQGSPEVGLELTQCRTRIHEPWDYDLSPSQMLNQLSHPGTPYVSHLLMHIKEAIPPKLFTFWLS